MTQQSHSWVYIQTKLSFKDIPAPLCSWHRYKLLTIAKTWKQPKCPLTDEWIKKMWYIYTMEYYSATTKKKMMPFKATWMQLEIFILSKVSQKEKYKYRISLIYAESKIWHK